MRTSENADVRAFNQQLRKLDALAPRVYAWAPLLEQFLRGLPPGTSKRARLAAKLGWWAAHGFAVHAFRKHPDREGARAAWLQEGLALAHTGIREGSAQRLREAVARLESDLSDTAGFEARWAADGRDAPPHPME